MSTILVMILTVCGVVRHGDHADRGHHPHPGRAHAHGGRGGPGAGQSCRALRLTKRLITGFFNFDIDTTFN